MALKKPIILLIIFVTFTELAYSADSHCTKQELTLFNCRIDKKVVSVCASEPVSTKSGYLQYRFGSLAAPELIYPSKKIRPGKWLSGNTLIFSGGGGAYLRFIRNRYHYVVYTAIGHGWGEKAGVSIEKDGYRKVNLSCSNPPITELGPDLFERAQITMDQIGFELPE